MGQTATWEQEREGKNRANICIGTTGIVLRNETGAAFCVKITGTTLTATSGVCA